MKFYYVTSIFDLHNFDNETTALLKFFEISTEMHFVFSFFVIERNITTSLLMIESKCAVVNYANLNSRPIIRSIYGPLNMLFRFFSISYLCLFQQRFCQKLYGRTVTFYCKFPKFISRCSMYIMEYQDVTPCDIKMTAKQVFLTYFLKECGKRVLKISKSIAIENLKIVPLRPIKCRSFDLFMKLHKSPLLIANSCLYLSGLRSETTFGDRKPLKIDKKIRFISSLTLFSFSRYQ